ncbi:DNA primase small subunit [Diachasma alloeum]|uniref:DNA primase small subunit n=1 Tax=Diachasma alloeum TaxID=454923 RepID=UPI0007384302|nr:DNA primase small subunit [Diachasma alloeum]
MDNFTASPAYKRLQIMKNYYKNHFPITPLWNFVQSGNESDSLQRELAFVSITGGWSRFQFFNDDKQLHQSLISKYPKRIDLGAKYRLTPRKKKPGEIEKKIAEEHELVLDIDINDYDEVRTCCKGPNMCDKCWKFMAIACEILEEALRRDFQLKHILWTYSGRRGIHGWVCDEKARTLNWKERNAVAKSLQSVRCKSKGISPQVERALNVIRAHFEEIIEEQGLLDTPEGTKYFLGMLQPESIKTCVERAFMLCNNTREKLHAFQDLIVQVKKREECYLVEEVMIQCFYPRLDLPVTTQISHLLKAPFSMHPATERISIPFRAERVWEFRVQHVPVISAIAGLEGEVENREVMVSNFREATDFFHSFAKGLISEAMEAMEAMEEGAGRLKGGQRKLKLRTRPETSRPGLWLDKLAASASKESLPRNLKIPSSIGIGEEASAYYPASCNKLQLEFNNAKIGSPSGQVVGKILHSSCLSGGSGPVLGSSYFNIEKWDPMTSNSRDRLEILMSLRQLPMRIRDRKNSNATGIQEVPVVEPTAENGAMPFRASFEEPNNTQQYPNSISSVNIEEIIPNVPQLLTDTPQAASSNLNKAEAMRKLGRGMMKSRLETTGGFSSSSQILLGVASTSRASSERPNNTQQSVSSKSSLKQENIPQVMSRTEEMNEFNPIACRNNKRSLSPQSNSGNSFNKRGRPVPADTCAVIDLTSDSL